MVKKNACLLLFVLLLISCNNRVAKNEVISVQSELIIPDSMLRKPTTLCLADDYLLVCNMDADTIIDVFNFEGKHINSFLPKGQGPEDGLFVVHLQYDKKNECIYAPDVRKSCLFRFSNIAYKPHVEKIFKYKCELNDSVYLLNWYGKLANGDIIAGNASGGGMLSRFSGDGKFMEYYVDFPDKKLLDEKLTDYANGSLYVPVASVSPDGDKVAFVYDNADIVTIATLNSNNQIETKSIRNALPNDVLAVQFGEKTVVGSITGKTIIYYESVTTSQDYIYALYMGRPYDDIAKTGYNSTIVKVYNWDGQLCKELSLDKNVNDIKVTPDDQFLYAIEESEDGYNVLKYKI